MICSLCSVFVRNTCLLTYLLNNIITTEQLGGEKDVWGCFEQLLINKTVIDVVRINRRSLITMWLDYQNAFECTTWVAH